MQRLALETVLPVRFLLVAFVLMVASPFVVAQDVTTMPMKDTTLLTAPERVSPPSFAAGNLINSAIIAGGAPLGITYNSADETILVADLFDGEAFAFDQDLVAGDSIPAPRGAAGPANWPQVRGIEFVAADANDDDNIDVDSIFWVQLDVDPGFAFLEFVMIQSDLEGTELESVPFAGAFGLGSAGGLAYNDVTGTFVIDDIANDDYREFAWDPDADEIEPTGRIFKNPRATDFGALGNGVTHVDGTGCFDVSVGGPFDDFVNEIRRVDIAGGDAANPVATSQVIDLGGLLDTFINGIHYTAAGAGGGPVCYVVGNATGTLYEIDLDRPCSGCTIEEPPTDMMATSTADGTITVTWEIDDATDVETIEIVVDGVVELTADDVFDLTADVTVGAGLHDVTIRYSNGDDTCDMATCRVAVSTEEAYSVAVPPLIGGLAMSLLGICINETTDEVVLPDLFGGQTLFLDRDLTGASFEFSPTTTTMGEATTTWFGIAFRPGDPDDPDVPDEDRYYWMTENDDVPPTLQLIVTDTDLVYIEQFDVTPPGGGPAWCIDLMLDGSGLILNDVAADEYYFMNFDGTFQEDAGGDPVFFPIPFDDVPIYVGNGVAAGDDFYAIAIGEFGETPFGGPNKIVTVDEDGNLHGCTTIVGPEVGGQHTNYDPFVNGIAFTNEGPGGADGLHLYSVGNSFGRVFVEPFDCEPCIPASDVTCIAEDGDVTLEWINNQDSPDEIRVVRNGEVIATLDSDESTYTDDAIAIFGDLNYEIVTDCGTSTGVALCSISVADPEANVLVLDKEPDTGEIDSAGAVAEALSAFAELTVTTVSSIDDIDLDQFDAVFAFFGTSPNIGVMSLDDGDKLSDFMLLSEGKGVYAEGGDLCAQEVLPVLGNTDFQDNDSVTVADPEGDGDRICDVGGVTGVESDVTTAPDLSDVEADHDCEGGFVDELEVDADAGAGIVLENSDDGSHALMIFQDGDESIGFTFRSLVSSIELGALNDITIGGVAAELTDLVEIIYEALTGDEITLAVTDGPEFIRCDCDGNGSFSALLDALFMMRYGFAGGDDPTCFRVCDCDGGGSFSPLLDALRAMQYFFAGGEIPPEPFETCGPDEENLSIDVECAEEPSCI